MDIIKKIFNEQGRVLRMELSSAGFSRDQIRTFFPGAIESILKSVKKQAEKSAICSVLEDPSKLLASVNTRSLETQLGIGSGQARSGLEVFVSVLSHALTQKSRGLIGPVNGELMDKFIKTTIERPAEASNNPESSWFTYLNASNRSDI